jgi:hypothetical protein
MLLLLVLLEVEAVTVEQHQPTELEDTTEEQVGQMR